MGMPRLEKLMVNNSLRTLMQELIPTPFFLKNRCNMSRPCCLEIGCGQGAGAKIIFKKFKAARVVALDYDLEQVRLAQKKLHSRHIPGIFLLSGDASRLSFACERFDAVFDYGILHHVPAWRDALSEIYRVLKPGGCFFYEDITSNLLETYLFEKFFPHPKEAHFSREEFQAALVDLGFKLSANYELLNSYLLGVVQKVK